jgi:adenylate cyclase
MPETISIFYPNQRSVQVPRGTSVLEASRLAEIPHASACGGRALCSTCRVRVIGQAPPIPPAEAKESALLDRLSLPPNVRLACQLRPLADIAVVPLLSPDAGFEFSRQRPSYLQGEEREVAVLFADLRGFTRITQSKLPYDVVFLLNQYFQTMDEAIVEAGGQVSQFYGDGIMALFGVASDFATACSQSIAAAHAMFRRLDRLNEYLGAELDAPLRIGIGIDGGRAIVGEMGKGRSAALAAIGDVVNAASRLQDLTKAYECAAVISQTVADAGGFSVAAELTGSVERREVELRGREGRLGILCLTRAAFGEIVLYTEDDRPVEEEDED